MSSSSTARRLIQPAILSLFLVFGTSCGGPDHNGDHCPDHANAQEPAPPTPLPVPTPEVDPAKAFDSLDLPDHLEPADPKFIKANELSIRKMALRLGPNAAAVKASKAEIEEIVPGFWVFKFGKGGTGSVVLLFTGIVGDEPVARMHQITVGSEPAPPGPGPAPPGPAPPVPVVPEPSAEMQTKVAPVKALLATGDAAKRAVLANVWADFAAALQASPPQSIGAFKSATQQFISAAVIRAGLTGAFPGYTAALDQSFALTFGDQDGKLDAAKAVAWAQALSWACK